MNEQQLCECGHGAISHEQTRSGEMGCDECFCAGFRIGDTNYVHSNEKPEPPES